MAEDIRIITFDFPVCAGITLREEGSMTGYEQKRKICSKVGLNENLVTVDQKHSRSVLTVDMSDAGKIGFRGDGLLTDDPETVLAVTVADCMPIYISDTQGRVFGVLHSGWKGTGILNTALRMMNSSYGVAFNEITVHFGPSIRSCCYAVDRKRAEIFRDQWGIDAAVERNGQFYLDLPAANQHILRAAGIKTATVTDYCTACSSIFGSYRREGPDHYTKMLAFIGAGSRVGRNASVST